MKYLKFKFRDSDTRFRTNYSESYNINFRDGDKRSSRNFLDQEEFTDSITGSNPDETRSMYNSPNLRALNDAMNLCMMILTKELHL